MNWENELKTRAYKLDNNGEVLDSVDAEMIARIAWNEVLSEVLKARRTALKDPGSNFTEIIRKLVI